MAEDSLSEESGTKTDFILDSSADGISEETGTKTDFTLTDQPSTSAIFDAAVKELGVEKEFTEDAAIAVTDRQTQFSEDAVIADQVSVSFSEDAAVQATNSATASFDMAIRDPGRDEGVTFDAAVKAFDRSATLTEDTVVVEQESVTVTEDAYVAYGRPGAVTVRIDGEEFKTFTNISIEKRLNELDTFRFVGFIEDSNDRALINEGNDVLIFEGRDLLFKGRLTEVEYKSNFRAKCEGDGMGVKLLNRKTDRQTYTSTAGDDIVKDVVSQDTITYGDIETAPEVSLRFDHDNKARAVAGVANATAYDWYVDQKVDDGYEKDYLNFVEDAGSDTVQETYDIGGNAELVERNKDEGFVVNDITLLGRGDGINQLETRVFAATTKFTDTTEVITEEESTSFKVSDATALGSTGDNIIARVGGEVMDLDITDSTTLSINSRGLNDYEGDSTEQIRHYDGVRVWLRENITAGEGPYTPVDRDSAEDGSSIEVHGVKQQRQTDKTIVDKSTLERAADIDLKNRFEDVFRVQVSPTEPRTTKNLQLGDKVTVKDLTAMDVDNDFEIVGMDIKRNSSEEGTVLHLANRPRRLTERLSEIERDRNTLNAHMQGATNIDSQTFSDNADADHPLDSKIYVPSDVVEVNKFELTFSRESFRGYVQNTDHSHDFDEENLTHTHDVDLTNESSDFTLSGDTESSIFISAGPQDDNQEKQFRDWDFDITTVTLTMDMPEFEGVLDRSILTVDFGKFAEQGTNGSSERVTFDLENADTGDTIQQDIDIIGGPNSVGQITVDLQDQLAAGEELKIIIKGGKLEPTDVADSPKFQDYLKFNLDAIGSHDHDLGVNKTSEPASGGTITTTKDSGAPNYGIYEPSSEPDIDVDVIVDGTTVKTETDVSVGDEIDTPIDLSSELDEPIAGQYHTIELVPVDTGGGENGRSRLQADVFQKVFIESTL